MDTDELIAELRNAAECDEPGLLEILPETFASAADALARAVREATDWRQRAEAAEAERDALRALIAKQGWYCVIDCKSACGVASGNGAGPKCQHCPRRYIINLPARPADGGAE